MERTTCACSSCNREQHQSSLTRSPTVMCPKKVWWKSQCKNGREKGTEDRPSCRLPPFFLFRISHELKKNSSKRHKLKQPSHSFCTRDACNLFHFYPVVICVWCSSGTCIRKAGKIDNFTYSKFEIWYKNHIVLVLSSLWRAPQIGCRAQLCAMVVVCLLGRVQKSTFWGKKTKREAHIAQWVVYLSKYGIYFTSHQPQNKASTLNHLAFVKNAFPGKENH